jgi:TPP-dependent pyruvate/acetoin dehydrogenase alpha subunit
MNPEEIEETKERIKQEIEEANKLALESPTPLPEESLTNIYFDEK